jgi:hypothetical protein
MFTNVNNYEMKMPKRYVELSEDEMEYDGRFGWIPICAVISAVCSYVVPVVTTVANNVGLIDNNTKNKIDGAAAIIGTVAGFASGIGYIGSSTAAAMVATTVTKAKTAQAAYDVSLGLGKGIYDGATGLLS